MKFMELGIHKNESFSQMARKAINVKDTANAIFVVRLYSDPCCGGINY